MSQTPRLSGRIGTLYDDAGKAVSDEDKKDVRQRAKAMRDSVRTAIDRVYLYMAWAKATNASKQDKAIERYEEAFKIADEYKLVHERFLCASALALLYFEVGRNEEAVELLPEVGLGLSEKALDGVDAAINAVVAAGASALGTGFLALSKRSSEVSKRTAEIGQFLRNMLSDANIKD